MESVVEISLLRGVDDLFLGAVQSRLEDHFQVVVAARRSRNRVVPILVENLASEGKRDGEGIGI